MADRWGRPTVLEQKRAGQRSQGLVMRPPRFEWASTKGQPRQRSTYRAARREAAKAQRRLVKRSRLGPRQS
jgi:hypothetical protein